MEIFINLQSSQKENNMNQRDLLILVGYQGRSQLRIVESLKKNNYNALAVRHMWPRDKFTCTGPGKYAIAKYSEDNSTPHEGGYYVPGNGFILASDRIAGFDRENTEKSYEKQAVAPVLKHLAKHCSHLRGHCFPSGFYHSQKVEEHLDMYAMVLPNKKVLIVDTYNKRLNQPGMVYHDPDSKERIETIAEREELELLWYDSSTEKCWYPMNTLVLPTEKTSDFVILDEKAINLMRILDERGIKFESVPTADIEYPQGKLHCTTNHIYLSDAGDNLKEFLNNLGITHIDSLEY